MPALGRVLRLPEAATLPLDHAEQVVRVDPLLVWLVVRAEVVEKLSASDARERLALLVGEPPLIDGLGGGYEVRCPPSDDPCEPSVLQPRQRLWRSIHTSSVRTLEWRTARHGPCVATAGGADRGGLGSRAVA